MYSLVGLSSSAYEGPRRMNNTGIFVFDLRVHQFGYLAAPPNLEAVPGLPMLLPPTAVPLLPVDAAEPGRRLLAL